MKRRKRHKKTSHILEQSEFNKTRYPLPDIWQEISRECRSRMPLCCVKGCQNLSKVTHHALYTDHLNRPLTYITVNDVDWLLGKYLFTLCLDHHDRKKSHQAHHKLNWYSGSYSINYIDGYQLPGFYNLLITGYQENLIALGKI
jgi:hypothetical protein